MRRSWLALAVVLVVIAVAAPLVVAFHGDEPAIPQVVVAPGHDNFAVVHRAGGIAGGTTVRWVATPGFPWLEREAVQRDALRDLAPGSAVDVGGATLHVPAADHLRVVFVGDTGEGPDAERVLAEAAAQKPDLVVHVGDVAYADGDERRWDHWMDLVATALPGVPIAYATGNHDVSTPLDVAQMESLRGGATYYSFDAGPVHVVVLDSNAVSDSQARWLDQDLGAAQAAGARWIVPVEHHPWYSSGKTHGSLAAARDAFTPIFARHGVKLAVAGHEHNYERTSAIEGVTYVVTGGGGAALYDDFQTSPPSWSAVRHEGHELLLVDFTEQGAQAKALAPDGSTVDSFGV